MKKLFDIYYFYYLGGCRIIVKKVSDDEYVHYLMEFDIYFISELPF